MTTDINTYLQQKLTTGYIFFDGGTGTVLQSQGLPAGYHPERWNIEQPEKIVQLHQAYIEAGADIIKTNTFGANRLTFTGEPSVQGGFTVKELYKAAVENAKEAVRQSGKSDVLIACDIGPSGTLLKPMGDRDFEELVSVFGECAAAGEAAGADIILIETMNEFYELKAAVLGAKEQSTLPIFATCAYGERGTMLSGATPECAVTLLESLGVCALGANCSVGPEAMEQTAASLCAAASIPVIINPNAGLPILKDGKTTFNVTPDDFAAAMIRIARTGACILGGCCGTTPAHIAALKASLSTVTQNTPKPCYPTQKNITTVCSYAQNVIIGCDPIVIGERINPTGKPKFRAALQNNDIPYLLNEAASQAEAGAHILDVNTGVPGINEPAVLSAAVYEIQSILGLPLQIDTSDPVAMEKAMRIYNGKPLINSVNGKQEVMNTVFPLVKKYGGTVVALTIDETGIPTTADSRIAVANKIIATAATYNIQPKDIIIDPLCMAVSAAPDAADVTLETVRRLTTQNRHTVLGVSNISFGLPMREHINTTFFTMALANGLSAAIINPLSKPMMTALAAYRALSKKDTACTNYIAKYAEEDRCAKEAKKKGGAFPPAAAVPSSAAPQQNNTTPSTENATQNGTADNNLPARLTAAIETGLKAQARQTAEALLTAQPPVPPLEIINTMLVPALDRVGKEFERGTRYLPQLLMSADAAGEAASAIKEHLTKTGTTTEQKGTIIVATVKGDVHDIGKNIVKVLLENYGYNVMDLGKDVPPRTIVDTAKEHNIHLVGLSALMTTTVPAMEETIALLHTELPHCRIMVGGAVLTKEFADMIHADFYSKDAMGSVRYADEVFSTKT